MAADIYPAPPAPVQERGAALLMVLMLVALMAIIASLALDRLRVATHLAANVVAMDQAEAYASSAEVVIAERLNAYVAERSGGMAGQGDWVGRAITIPLPEGRGVMTPQDGGNCFNVNSLVVGRDEADLAVRPVGVIQFQALMHSLGIDERQAAAVADAAADWIDSDEVPQPGGAEDDAYTHAAVSYRTPNRFMTDVSELRAVRGVTPALYATLKPWLCALPRTDLAPINVNTLFPQQAPLFAMLIPGKLSVAGAREILERRPLGGYESAAAFWASPALSGLTPPAEVADQVQTTSQFFRVVLLVELGEARVATESLYDARTVPVRLIARHFGNGSS